MVRGLRFWGVRVQGRLGSRAQGFRIYVSEFTVWGFEVRGFWFRALVLRFTVQGSGFRV